MTSANRSPVRRPHCLERLSVCLLVFAAGGPAAALAQPADAGPGRPLTLAEAFEMAIETSPQVTMAESALARAGGEQQRARAEGLPQLIGMAGYTRTLATEFAAIRNGNGLPTDRPGPEACAPFAPDPALAPNEQIVALAGTVECVARASPLAGFRDLFADLPFGRRHQYSVGLTLNQPVFTGGRVAAQRRMATAQHAAAEVGVLTARAQAALDVAEVYYDAALGDRLVAIAEASYEHADTTLDMAVVQFRAGTLAEFDVLRARVLRDNQRPAIIQRRAERDLAHLRLKQLIDVPAHVRLELQAPLDDVPVPPLPARLVTVTDQTAEDSPPADLPRATIRQALRTVEMQEDRLRIATAQRLPAITVGSWFSRVAYAETVAPGWNDFRTNWTIDVNLQVPLFTGGRIGGDVRVAQAELADARARLRQTRDLSLLESRDADAQLMAAEAVWAASAGTSEEAARALAIAEIRFREGVSTQLEVTDTQLQLQQAEINRARAARGLQIARIRLALLPYLPLSTPVAPGGRLPVEPARPLTPAPPPAQPAFGAPRTVELTAPSPAGGRPR